MPTTDHQARCLMLWSFLSRRCRRSVPGRKLQRGRINAEPHAGRSGTIAEDMTQMRIAAATSDFNAHASMAAVEHRFQTVFAGRLGEAGPAGSRFKFVIGRKELTVTADAPIVARRLVIPIRAGERPLGSTQACDFVLVSGQNLPPLGMRLAHFVIATGGKRGRFLIGLRGRRSIPRRDHTRQRQNQ